MTPPDPRPGDARPPEPPPDEGPFELVTRVVSEEPLLWPVATVAWLIFCTFGAFVLFFALRVRSLPAGVALLFVLFLTVWGLDRDIRARRLSGQNKLVLSLWAGSAVGAFGLEWLG
jgi:hypothetical protein